MHFGPGAFHRAHQGAFVDRLLSRDPRWGVTEVSLRSGEVTAKLAGQDGLYALAVLEAEPRFQVIGAVAGWIGPGEGSALLAKLRDPAIAVVTSTVTEKGYCFDGAGALDFAHPDIVHDLADPARPLSLIGWLVRALGARREDGVAPFAAIPCDNMLDNGARLAWAVEAFARRLDPGLADWIAGEARFASTMVDAITPASDAALLDRVELATGLRDEAAVQREGFAQWVIEDVLPPGGPDWRAAGVTITLDVAGFERAKLRILNGAHSALAYLGMMRGYETVADAMRDDILAAFVRTMMERDVAPGLGELSDLDLPAYIDAVFTRFRNPAIRHLLSQIAWDGSQKLPYRMLDSVIAARATGRPLERLLLPVAAWMRFVERTARRGETLVDPLRDRLVAAATDPAAAVDRFLAIDQVFPSTLAGDPEVRRVLGDAHQFADDPATLDHVLRTLS